MFSGKEEVANMGFHEQGQGEHVKEGDCPEGTR